MGENGERKERPVEKRGKRDRIPIAKLGRSYGVRGWQKIHFLTDFPEQFKPGMEFEIDKGRAVIEDIDLERGLVKLKGVDSPEEARKFTNRHIYTTEERSRSEIELGEGEYFWFDIIGCEVVGSIPKGDLTQLREELEQKLEEASQSKKRRKRRKGPNKEELEGGLEWISKGKVTEAEMGEEGEGSTFSVGDSSFADGEEREVMQIGKVVSIERYNDIDYIVVEVNPQLVGIGFPKRILLQFDRHIEKVDLSRKRLYSNFIWTQLSSLK